MTKIQGTNHPDHIGHEIQGGGSSAACQTVSGYIALSRSDKKRADKIVWKRFMTAFDLVVFGNHVTYDRVM